MTFICIGDFLRFNPVSIVVYMQYNGYRTVALLITIFAVNDVTVQYHSILQLGQLKMYLKMTFQANYLTEGLQKCTFCMDIPLTIVVVSITMPRGIMTFYLPTKDCSQVL